MSVPLESDITAPTLTTSSSNSEATTSLGTDYVQPATAALAVVRAGVSLFRRLPASSGPRTVAALTALAPAHAEAFLTRCDVPPVRRLCARSGRPYLLCEFSRDGDSYRSPWTNEYDPPLPDGGGLLPSPSLRAFEVAANEALSAYANAYYAGVGSSGDTSSSASLATSVYAWDLAAPGAFASAWILSKETASGDNTGCGAWHAQHVAEAVPTAAGGRMRYRLTSTVLLAAAGAGSGSLMLSGSLTRTAAAEHSIGYSHVTAIGSLLEQSEADVRAAVASLYFAKSRELVRQLRRGNGADGRRGGSDDGSSGDAGVGRTGGGCGGNAVAYAAAAALAARRAAGGVSGSGGGSNGGAASI